MKKRIMLKYGLIIAGLVTLVVITGWTKDYFFPRYIGFQANWGVKIPSGFKEVYHESIVGFHGDGYRYTVFKTKNNAHMPMIKFFYNHKDPNVEDFINKIADNLEVSDKQRIALDQPYLWWVVVKERYYKKQYYYDEIFDDPLLYGDALVIVYTPSEGKYYFLEFHV